MYARVRTNVQQKGHRDEHSLRPPPAFPLGFSYDMCVCVSLPRQFVGSLQAGDTVALLTALNLSGVSFG